MSNKLWNRVAAICLLAVWLAFGSLAQDAKAVAGTWNMTAETDNDSVKWTLILKESDGKLSAAVGGQSGEEHAVADFTFKDGVLKFKTPYEGEYYDIELKVDGGKLKGTWSGGGNSGAVTGTK